MGKEKKQKLSRHKDNPVGLSFVQDTEKEENLNKESSEQTIERIIEELNSANMEEKLNGIQTLEAMCCERTSAIRVSRNEIIKMLGPFLIDQSNIIRAASAITFRSIADNGGEEAVSNLLKNDIITPLAALLKQYYTTWRPNIDSSAKIKNTTDYEKETFIQAVSLLWTLAEKNDIVLKRSEEEDLLNVLMPFLNTQMYDLETSIVAIQCILTLSEENPKVLTEIKMKKEQVLKLFELEPSNVLNEAEILMLRTLAAGLVVNIYNGFSKNEGISVAGKSLTLLSKTLSFDYEEKIEKIVVLLEKEKNNLTNKTKKKLQELKTIINAQIQAVEILANLCIDQEYSDVESDFDNSDSYMNDVNNEEINDDEINEPMNEEYIEVDSHICIEAKEIIASQELIQKVLNKTCRLPSNIEQIFQTCDEGVNVLKRFHALRCRSFLCLTNFILNLNNETLGGVDHLFRIWNDTGKVVFSEIDPNDVELLDAATSLMRSALQKIKDLQANPFHELKLSDLQPMLNGEQQSSSPSVRANLINILGSLSLILVKSNLIHTGELIKCISEFLLNSCMSETEVWVIAEALDAIMDIYAEDETDEMALEINLISKLSVILPILQTKFRQQKRSLGSNMTIVSTVKANLGRFLTYKKKRVSLLRK